jgi:hypothetical protein
MILCLYLKADHKEISALGSGVWPSMLRIGIAKGLGYHRDDLAYAFMLEHALQLYRLHSPLGVRFHAV